MDNNNSYSIQITYTFYLLNNLWKLTYSKVKKSLPSCNIVITYNKIAELLNSNLAIKNPLIFLLIKFRRKKVKNQIKITCH